MKQGSANVSYIHQDHLTGTSTMNDSSGALDSSITYTPFGLTRSGSVPTDIKFTGQKVDNTGLYYYGARYYDPAIGRFISADTVGQHLTNPQTLNRYSYVANNPLRYTDPTGHDWLADEYGFVYWDDGPPDDSGENGVSGPSLPLDSGDGAAILGEIPGEGIGSATVILSMRSSIIITDHSIIDRSIATKDGGRVMSVEGPHTRWGEWHFNADVGPFAGLNETKMPTIVGRSLQLAPKILVGISIAVDTADIIASVNADQGTFGHNTAQAVGRVAGSWGGALAGAAIGATAGAGFLGIGAVPDAFIGGIIGSFGGSLGGQAIGGWLR